MSWLLRGAMAVPTVLPTAKHTATVIFLHGLGDTGHGWLAGLDEIKLPYVKYICPNAPINKVSLNFGMQMPSWFDIKSLDFKGEEDEPGLKKSTDIVFTLINEEIKSGISSDRIIVGGFSQGGSVAFHTLQTSEHKLAGCIGLSTWMSMHDKFEKITKPVNKDTPVFQGHGNADPVVKYTYGQMTEGVLKKYYTKTKFQTYGGLGHSSSPQEMSDVQDFIEKCLPKI